MREAQRQNSPGQWSSGRLPERTSWSRPAGEMCPGFLLCPPACPEPPFLAPRRPRCTQMHPPRRQVHPTSTVRRSLHLRGGTCLRPLQASSRRTCSGAPMEAAGEVMAAGHLRSQPLHLPGPSPVQGTRSRAVSAHPQPCETQQWTQGGGLGHVTPRIRKEGTPAPGTGISSRYATQACRAEHPSGGR